MLEALEARVADAVAMAGEEGAQGAWAVASRSRGVETIYRDGALEKLQESTSRSLQIELYVDGRYSSHGTTDLRPGPLRAFIRDAVALTRALEPDAFRELPDPRLYEGRPDDDLELVDGTLADLHPDQRARLCLEMNEIAGAHERVISTTAFVSDGHSVRAAASSNGFRGSSEGTAIWMGADVTIRDQGDVRPEGYMFAGARHQRDLPPISTLAEDALLQATRRLGSKKGPTTRATMVVDPRAAGRLLGALLEPATASAVQRERSFWRGRHGERVASEALTVTDEPLLMRGLASRHFDAEGISSRRMPLVDRGRAAGLYVDTYYGKKLGMAPTTCSPSNRLVAKGARGLAEILRAVGTGVYVTSWLGGNSDATSGDFSLGMRGHLIENGVVGEPVGEMNVTGNLMALFGQLVEVGNDPWPYATLLTPTLVFDGVDFSGA